jgi:signal recognition particle subunit SRP54
VNSAVRESKLDVKKLETEELNFETFYEQLEAMGKMGPLKGLFGMMGATNVPNEVMEQSEEKLKKYKIIISSMTRTERRDEKLLHQQSRIERIAKGSGTSEREVRMLVSEFNKMRKTFNVLKNDRDFKRRFKMG